MPATNNSSDHKLSSLMMAICLEFDDGVAPDLSAGSFPDNQRRFSHASTATSISCGQRSQRSLSNIDSLISEATQDDEFTLCSYEANFPAMSGILHKLRSDYNPRTSLEMAPATAWKEGYVLLTEEATLLMFRDNSDPNARPLCSLPITSVHGTFDKSQQCWILKIHGTSVAPSGATLFTQWALKCPDETVMMQWRDCVSIVLECKDLAPAAASSSATGRQRSTSFSSYVPMTYHHSALSSIQSETGEVARNPSLASYLLKSRGNSTARPTSLPTAPHKRTNSAGFGVHVARPVSELSQKQIEERDARMRAMHEEYMRQQQAVAKQTFADCARRREEEQIAVAARRKETAEIEERMRRKLEAAKRPKRMPMNLFVNI
ncbi:hypothetical protein BC830DRAFT_1094450 [Chytriomyces sp. MP71]|nr:hypothetical protein BC830DRAFT_1094450 [Chytriomyces sp. MP71]